MVVFAVIAVQEKKSKGNQLDAQKPSGEKQIGNIKCTVTYHVMEDALTKA